MNNVDQTQGENSQKKRRQRYSGTHPRKFQEKYKELNIDEHPQLKEHLLAKGKTPAGTHIPIMVNEVMELLQPAPGDIVADCTLGYGGHAGEFMKRIGSTGKLIGFDVDASELAKTAQRLQHLNVPMSTHRSNFAGIAGVMAKEKIAGYNIIFADIGVSSMQIDNPDRGMSYKHNGPIDMRMDDRIKITGADLLNTLSVEDLSTAFDELADEEDHLAVAEMIASRRTRSPIINTSQLVELVFKAKGINQQQWNKEHKNAGSRSVNPAARVFQALRMLVNDELGALKGLLRVAPYCLAAGGRIGIISFHSGEDRLVKKAFSQGLEDGIFQAISENVIMASCEERQRNPRSSSAKFRWAIKA